MPQFDAKAHKQIKKQHKQERLAASNRCTAITEDEKRCSILVENSPDDKMLCHIHHPDRVFQQQQNERRAVFAHFKNL